MRAHLQRVLDQFPDARKVGRGWDARCPAHGDRHPSLTITMGDKNPDAVVMRCGAGCDTADVLASVGLTFADLYADSTRRTPGRILREHTYYDDQGTVLYRVRRLDGKQRWSYVHPTGDGWAKGRGDGPRVLYRLPELAANPTLPVMVCEGERDADKFADACGLLATAVASGSWEGVDLSALTGRYVFVVVDNDRTGWRRGLAALEHLQRAGALVEEVWAPQPQFKDATDMLADPRFSCDVFVTVDLLADDPPVETWDAKPTKPLWTAEDGDGKPNYAIVPTGLLLDSTLNSLDRDVYALADDKASKSGIAHLTQAQLANQLGVRRQTIAASLERLEAGDWIEQPRRGRIVVKNAARERTPRARASTPTPTPSPHEYPVPQRTFAERPIQHRAEAHSTSSERSPRGPFDIDPGADG